MKISEQLLLDQGWEKHDYKNAGVLIQYKKSVGNYHFSVYMMELNWYLHVDNDRFETVNAFQSIEDMDIINAIVNTYNGNPTIEDTIEVLKYIATGCTHDNPYELDIDIEGTMGLSESEKIKYLSIYMNGPKLMIKIGDIWEYNTETKEFLSLPLNEIEYIGKELKSVLLYCGKRFVAVW